jgi:hypothetical protein
MATLDSLKRTLRQKVTATASSLKQPLPDTQYSAGFDILVRDSGWMTYQDFIIPQLSKLLAPLFNSRIHISILDIGPGPRILLGCLPDRLRRKVKRYTAFEPKRLVCYKVGRMALFYLRDRRPAALFRTSAQHPPNFHSFWRAGMGSVTSTCVIEDNEKYDIDLFCHSMYGMKPKDMFIERALEMLVEQPQGGMVVVIL